MPSSKLKFKVGNLVKPLRLIPGHGAVPSLPSGSCCKVTATALLGSVQRLRLEREDGQPGFWWVDAGDVEPVA